MNSLINPITTLCARFGLEPTGIEAQRLQQVFNLREEACPFNIDIGTFIAWAEDVLKCNDTHDTRVRCWLSGLLTATINA